MSSCGYANGHAVRTAISLVLFGGFRLFYRGRPTHIPHSCQRLVTFLAFRSSAARAELAGSLWPEVDEARALGSLRTSVWQVHRRCPGLLVADGEQLRVSECVHVDMLDFEDRACRILHNPQGVSLVDLMEEWQELLPGWYDDWVLLERERARQLQLHVLEAAGEELLYRHKPGPALCVALHAVQIEPLRESTHRLVIRIHISEGNVYEAVRHYRMYLRLLHNELGVSPTRQLQELVAGLVSNTSVDVIRLQPSVNTL